MAGTRLLAAIHHSNQWKDPICGEELICVVAAQDYDVGDIWVKANEDCLWIELALDPGFTASETHVEVVLNPAHFPLTPSGSPKIGHFRYTAEECIDISDIPCDTWVYIAFHAVIWGEFDGEWTEETGWGCWDEEWIRSWGGYFAFLLPCCDKTEDDCKDLPTEDFCVKHIAHWGHHGYFDTLVYGDSAPLVDPYDWLEDGDPRYAGNWWVGWCADADTYLSLNTPYCTATIYCTLMDMTGHSDIRISATDWHAINWILNHKAGYTIGQIQQAIWWFTNNDEPPSGAGKTLRDAAVANAPGWSPQPGDHVAYIIWVDYDVQMTFIEVDP
jgi:hypothetical protein